MSPLKSLSLWAGDILRDVFMLLDEFQAALFEVGQIVELGLLDDICRAKRKYQPLLIL